MSIEELKAEWEKDLKPYGLSVSADPASSRIEELMYKLLAVAETAELEREKQNTVGDSVCVELQDALDDLLEDKNEECTMSDEQVRSEHDAWEKAWAEKIQRTDKDYPFGSPNGA